MPTLEDYVRFGFTQYPYVDPTTGGYTTLQREAVHLGVVGGLAAPGLAGVALGASGTVAGSVPKETRVMPNGLAVMGAAKIGHRVSRHIRKLFHRGKHAISNIPPEHKAGLVQAVKDRLFGGGPPALPGGAMMGGFGGPPGMGAPGVRGHWTKAHGHVPSHWSNRRRPRMHATNPRALRRAMRRMESFGRLAHRYVQLHHHHHFRKKPLKRKAA